MKKLKVAVIGAGAMGASHVRVYSKIEDIDLIAVCDNNKETSSKVADKYEIKSYTSYEEMFENESLDAVSICVPTNFHKEVVLCAIKNKINVLVEKPIADSIEDAQEMIDEAKKNNAKLMVGHIERFNPVVVELKKRLDKNELGKIYKAHSERLSPFPKRIVDVGVIIDLAIHEIDILKHIIGSKITRVFAETAQRIHSKYEDLLIGTLRFENGILGVINTNWLTPKKIREIRITGEKGMIVANYLTQEMHFYENEFTNKNFNYDRNYMDVVEGKKSKIKINVKEPLKNELEAFINCIQEDKNPPVTGEEGLEALNIAQNFLKSSDNNEVIDL